MWLKADAMNEHPECVIKDTPEEAIGLENVNGPLTRLSTTTTKLSLRVMAGENNAARTLVMPVIKENTLTEGNNNH
ncbi:hypothetical protein DMH88_12325 [Escherichia coli]|nr:hypothetical protein [Escherichia coli]